MRRAANNDKNQPEIVKALRQIGVSVEIIRQPVDLLCWYRGEYSLMEIKNPDGFDRLTKDQVEFIARWPGKIHIVRTTEEAVRAIVDSAVLA